MKTILLFSTLFLLLSINTGCNKDLATGTIESRLIGTWRMDKVKFNPEGSLPSRDVSNKFRYYKYMFTADFYVTFVNTKTQETYEGYYYINEIVTWDEENQENDIEKQLVMSFYDPISTETKTLTWKNLQISNSKFKAKERRNDGTYSYFLEK